MTNLPKRTGAITPDEIKDLMDFYGIQPTDGRIDAVFMRIRSDLDFDYLVRAVKDDYKSRQ